MTDGPDLDRLYSRDDPFLVFDLESTGVDTETARIVTSCVALVPKSVDGGPRTPKVFERLVNPGIEIPAEASAIHGITTEYARQHGVEPAVALQEAAGLLRLAVERGIPIVVMNGRYDFTLLDRECQRHGVRPVADSPEQLRPVIDVFVVDKAADPFRKGRRRLENLCEHWGVVIEGAHNSTVDALATGRVAFKMARGPIPRAPSERPYREPQVDLTTMKLGDLHGAQVGWAAAQAKSLASHFRRLASMAPTPEEAAALRLKADDCRPEWPFVPRQAPAAETDQEALW